MFRDPTKRKQSSITVNQISMKTYEFDQHLKRHMFRGKKSKQKIVPSSKVVFVISIELKFTRYINNGEKGSEIFNAPPRIKPGSLSRLPGTSSSLGSSRVDVEALRIYTLDIVRL